MKLYCRGELVLATHDDGQQVDPAAYGDDVDVIVVVDGFQLDRIGEWEPAEGETEADDPRPFARPILDLTVVKAQIKAAIDGAAETERLKYITPGAGQAMTYQRKTEEARRLRAAIGAEEEIVPADYPLLAATIGIDGNTIAEVADIVIGMDNAWAVIGGAIEATRLGAKAAVDAAQTEVEARAVTPIWPQP